MIFRQYGRAYHSVDPNFDSKALSEVGFRRNHARSIPVDELGSRFEEIERVELDAAVEGDVQDETEQALLNELEARLDEVVARLPEGGVVVVENEQGHDYPKTRQKITTVEAGLENRLHFHYTIAPPLRVTAYRPKT